MYQYFFTSHGLKNLKKLPKNIQFQIIHKLDFCIASPNPLFHTKRIVDSSLGEYRIRLGDYRIICDIEGEIITVLRVGHRREIYK